MLERIQQDLFDFTDGEDLGDFGALLNFWYRANAPAVSAALTAQAGLKLIVDVPSMQAFEQLSKKLFLVADTIVLRGLTAEPHRDGFVLEQLIPTSGYKPGFLDDVIDDLKKLRPSVCGRP